MTEFTGNPIDAERVRYLKEHSIVLGNTNTETLLNVELFVRLPEPVVYNFAVVHPPGTEVVWEPFSGMKTMVTTGVTHVENGTPYPITPHFLYRLQISSLPPSKSVEVRFLTSNDPHLKFVFWAHDNIDNPEAGTFDLNAGVDMKTNMQGIMPKERPQSGTSSLLNFLIGTYQYGPIDEPHEASVFSPIVCDENRHFGTRGVYRSADGFHIVQYWGNY
jgi:hypothetical protein